MSTHGAPTQDSICDTTTPLPGASQQTTPDNNEIPTLEDSNMGENESEQPLTLGKTRSLTSVVWNHFKKQKVGDKWKAVCNYCKKHLGGESRNGTKHLHDHFRSCPLRKTRDIKQAILGPKIDADEKFSVGTHTFDEETARKELASMIILHEYPLNMVEHFGFRRFVGALQPLFKVVSRTTVKNDISKIYEFERAKTMRILEENTSRIAITTDMWTANHQKKGYMAVTAHFVDDEWKLQNRIIRFIYVPCPHTAEVLGDVLLNCLVDWNLDRKLSTLTLDNCTTNDAMINSILSKLDSSSLWLDGSLLHMRCCAHILNLIVRDGLDLIGDGIETIRGSVAFWVATPKRCEKFEETARQLKHPFSRKLALDCKTRWNSTYKMLDIAISYKDVFNRLKQREPLYKNVPTDDEWETARVICDKLQTFSSVTELFSGTDYPTANLYFPQICQMKVDLMEWLVCGNLTVEKMAMEMLKKFDKYWFHINGIMGVATVLDPRYKLRLLHYYFPQIYVDEQDAKREIQRIQYILSKLVHEYSLKSKASGVGASSQPPPSSASSSSNPKKKRSMEGYDKFVADDFPDVKSDLDNYLEERVIPRFDPFDILGWWKNAHKYPILQMIARDVLAIPISTVASESAFSTGGRFVSPHRSRLHNETIEALMCSQDWLWNEAKELGGAFSQSCTLHDDTDDVVTEISGVDTFHAESAEL